jgi:hypothetical protein
VFATSEFGLGGLQLAQSILPLGLETARDQAVIGIDGAVTAFGALRAVARTLDISAELLHGGLVIRFELLGGLDRRFEACGRQRREERGCDRRIDLAATDVQTVLAAAVDDGLAGAVITGRGVAAACSAPSEASRSRHRPQCLAAMRCLPSRRLRVDEVVDAYFVPSAFDWPRTWASRCSRRGDRG